MTFIAMMLRSIYTSIVVLSCDRQDVTTHFFSHAGDRILPPLELLTEDTIIAM